MKKISIFTGFIFVFSVASIIFVVMECRRHLEEQYVFMLERKRIAIIGLGEELYRFSSEEFRERLICEINDIDSSFKRVIEGRGKEFLMSANIDTRGIDSRADHVYELFDISKGDILDMCGGNQ